jgi:hypothetical protein
MFLPRRVPVWVRHKSMHQGVRYTVATYPRWADKDSILTVHHNKQPHISGEQHENTTSLDCSPSFGFDVHKFFVRGGYVNTHRTRPYSDTDNGRSHYD